MSGIIALFQLDGAPVDQDLLCSLTAYLSFRGPDGLAIFAGDALGMGWSYLRIGEEIAAEQQPLSFDGKVWMVADARLDGRAELLTQLRAAGRVIAADAPDGELLLHAYHIWQEQCLAYLYGDFAFVIWDGSQQRLFAAHDHYGVVPVYYAQHGATLIISNTLSALLQVPGLSHELNEQAVADMLTVGMNYALDRTFYEAIRRLPPGHALTVGARTNEVSVWRYWEPPAEGEYTFFKPDEVVEGFLHYFDQAVRDRLRAKQVGMHLSGGLDSSSIAATAQRLFVEEGKPFDLRAYTVVHETIDEDKEGDYATLVAKMNGIRHEKLVAEPYVSAAPLENPNVILAEPVVIGNRTPEAGVRLQIASFSRVMLTGFGGDPALAMRSGYLRSLLHDRSWGALLRAFIGSLRVNGRLPRGRLRRRRQTVRLRIFELPPWFNPDFVERVGLEERLRHYATNLWDRTRLGMAEAPLWSNIFGWGDPGFGGGTLRIYHPFFDRRLTAFLAQVAPVPWLEDKTVLRVAMRGRLPEQVLTRPKTPFPTNLAYRGLRQQGVEQWMKALGQEPLLAPYIDLKQVADFLANPEKLDAHLTNQLHVVFTLGYWLKHQHLARTAQFVYSHHPIQIVVFNSNGGLQ